MEVNVEITLIDLRYEACRMRNAQSEKRLLQSVLQQGLRDPLLGTMREGVCILVDGFKRLRCAKKLAIPQAAVSIIGTSEAEAILVLIQRANAQSLTILEQAKLVGELKGTLALSVSEIARRLERSVAWVSVRTGLLTEMKPRVIEKIMRGEFPAYVYMYTLRPFMRINNIQPAEIEEFVLATSGRGLSTRDLGLLASAYFRGGDEIRQEIQKGNIDWCLNSLKPTEQSASSSLSAPEQKLIRDFDIVASKMKCVIARTDNTALSGHDFLAQAHLVCGGVLRLLQPFTLKVRGLHDRSRPAP